MRKNLSLLLALVMAFTVLCGNLGAIAFAEPIGAITEPIEGTEQLGKRPVWQQCRWFKGCRDEREPVYDSHWHADLGRRRKRR